MELWDSFGSAWVPARLFACVLVCLASYHMLSHSMTLLRKAWHKSPSLRPTFAAMLPTLRAIEEARPKYEQSPPH